MKFTKYFESWIIIRSIKQTTFRQLKSSENRLITIDNILLLLTTFERKTTNVQYAQITIKKKNRKIELVNEEFFKSVFQKRKKSINFNTIMTFEIQNVINEIIKQYVSMNSSIFDFSDSSNSSDNFESLKQFVNSFLKATFHIFKWNWCEIDFFNSMFDEKSTKTEKFIKHVEKNTYFKNVYLFIEKVLNIATIHDNQLIRKNLFICFKETTFQWYTFELFFEIKQFLRYDDKINHWIFKLLKRFKKSIDISINVIFKKRYTMKNARRHRKLREYAFKILRTVKSIELKSISNQVTIIYSDLNIEFRRDLTKSITVIALKFFLKEMNDFKKNMITFDLSSF